MLQSFRSLVAKEVISYKTFDTYFCTDRMSLQHNPSSLIRSKIPKRSEGGML